MAKKPALPRLPALLRKKARPVIILTTLPDMVAAEKISFQLVELKLAACVNILPDVQSIYHWDGKLVREREAKLLIKTSSERLNETRAYIKANHPYSVPEITTIGENGDVAMQNDYWEWLESYIRRA
ncbi:MAG: divalent-cation tolerance protein CutA [Leptospiraceae bacterium]|nr:divalent-cation tolerance protein CutA [Leptospiraceae bacterium]